VLDQEREDDDDLDRREESLGLAEDMTVVWKSGSRCHH
jgi:hypothetical protein